MFSTITTAPSTTIPKSSAPSDNKFAGTWIRLRQIHANNSENGMVSATMSEPRAFPRNMKRMMATSRMPSVRLWSTVWVVR
jgi:hypothetical protein